MKAAANFTIFFCTWGFEFATRFEFVTHRQRDDQRRNDTTRTGCDLTVPKHTVRKTGTELKQEPDGTEVESASPNSLHLLVGHGLNLANHKIQGVRIRAPVSNCGGEGLLYSFAAIDVRICVLCRKNQPLRRLLHQSTGDAISHISQL